jgi:hypothetical protein
LIFGKFPESKYGNKKGAAGCPCRALSHGRNAYPLPKRVGALCAQPLLQVRLGRLQLGRQTMRQFVEQFVV